MDLKTALGGGICLRAYIHPRSVECDHLSSPVETARHQMLNALWLDIAPAAP
jgi:hypothetical protein